MLWYGYKSTHSPKIVSKEKYRYNAKARTLNFRQDKSFFFNYNKFLINLPDTWNFILFKNYINQGHVIYMYNTSYFFRFPTPMTNYYLFFDQNIFSICIYTLYTQNFYKTYWNMLLAIFNSFNRPFFLKVKFKGKGYYIFKNKRQVITPQFGHAHRLYFYAYFASVRFLSKTSIYIFGLIQTDLLKIGYGIKKMRSINIFTGRGVRFSRQVIYKKVGKVSSYR